jgi:hypothetical protein
MQRLEVSGADGLYLAVRRQRVKAVIYLLNPYPANVENTVSY